VAIEDIGNARHIFASVAAIDNSLPTLDHDGLFSFLLDEREPAHGVFPWEIRQFETSRSKITFD
jgi:hypothetical protein